MSTAVPLSVGLFRLTAIVGTLALLMGACSPKKSAAEKAAEAQPEPAAPEAVPPASTSTDAVGAAEAPPPGTAMPATPPTETPP
ncbi:hypothetical protein, partial [Caulobacter sp. 17J65-9]|uniref:hypothetical protein n=1 Tax=Caulobacter sp. 17J65-9 TaxID=2709382 RepID=UPI0013C5D6C7